MKAGAERPENGESYLKAEGQERTKRLLTIPFPFYNASIGPGIGLGVIAQGYVQPQAGFVMAALVGQGNYSVYLKALNYQFPWFKRVILEPDFYVAKYEDIDTYSGTDNPGFPGERAGSNNSDKNNYISSDANDEWVTLVTKFVLPIGQGRDNVIPKIVLDQGLFVSGDTGGDVWNPLESGRTYIEAIPFERRQSLIDNNTHSKTAGIDVGIRYDNTDLRLNPTKGSMGTGVPWTAPPRIRWSGAKSRNISRSVPANVPGSGRSLSISGP